MEILGLAYFVIGGGVVGLWLRRSRDDGDLDKVEPITIAFGLPLAWALWPILLGSKKVIPWKS